jgi:hypothetical protein
MYRGFYDNAMTDRVAIRFDVLIYIKVTSRNLSRLRISMSQHTNSYDKPKR